MKHKLLCLHTLNFRQSNEIFGLTSHPSHLQSCKLTVGRLKKLLLSKVPRHFFTGWNTLQNKTLVCINMKGICLFFYMLLGLVYRQQGTVAALYFSLSKSFYLVAPAVYIQYKSQFLRDFIVQYCCSGLLLHVGFTSHYTSCNMH